MSKKGFALIEIVVGIAILSVALFAFNQAIISLRRFADETSHVTQAAFLLEEGAEALRSIRDRGWTDNIVPIAQGTERYLTLSGGVWAISSTVEIVDGVFTRSFTKSAVSRDGTDDIVELGVDDPDTKLFTITVLWQNSRGTESSVNSALYLSNVFNE